MPRQWSLADLFVVLLIAALLAFAVSRIMPPGWPGKPPAIAVERD